MYRVSETGFPILREKIVRETRYATDASALFEGVGLMSMRRVAALQAGLLLAAMLANAASLKNTMRITVLDSVTRASAPIDNGVPKNCDGITFDAYCRSTTNVPLVNTLLVQEGDNPPFRITCTIESRFSRCAPLPKGATYDAKREKKGITVYYVDDKGKPRKEFYTLVAPDAKTPTAAAAVVAPQPVSAAAGNAVPIPATHAAAPVQNSPVTVTAVQAATSAQISPAPAPARPPAVGQSDASAKIKCNFTSTPPGAEINVDWRYVGNTPSEIGLSPGTHVVTISMPGFAEWKRELTVAADSAVNVSASLQKTQP